MKHIMGNSPKCSECFHFARPEPWEKCKGDGWCTNQKHLSIGINGKKREHPPEKEAKRWNGKCSFWEDAEYPHINEYEAETGNPDPNRGELEQMIIRSVLEEQRNA